jgi:hypothetical protein
VQRTWLIGIALALVLGPFAWPAATRAADDPLRLDVAVGAQFDRLHSALADSVGLSVSHATVVVLGYDFRVFNVPMSGADKPSLHVLGDVALGKRPLPVRDFAGPGFTGAPVVEVPVAEVIAGIGFRLPMTMIDAGAGSALVLGYRGGLLLSSGGQNDFPHVKQVVFGFERTRGFLEGSAVEMAYGTNEAAGRQYGAHRWGARVLLMGSVGGGSATDGAVVARAAPGKPAVAPRTSGSPVRIFLEFNVDTDGSVGPDLLMARTGLDFDAGRILSRVLGALN